MRRLALLLTLTCAAAIGLAAAPAPHLTLGVLRADGVMFPFASFDGDWSAPWPASRRDLTIPISVADVPEKWWGAVKRDARWTAALRDGTSAPLSLEALREVPVFCSTKLGILTNHRGALPEGPQPTVDKDGLAIAGDVSGLMPIANVSVLSPDARQIATAITDAFNDAEKKAADAFTSWKHPYKPEERRAMPFSLEALYWSSENTKRGEWRVSYVEAVRRFPERPEDHGCGLITYAYGWVLERPGQKPKIELAARVTYCDRDAVSFMLPFGRVALEGEVYWVYQLSSWTDEAYIVTRIRPDQVTPVVAVAGGNCPRRPARAGGGVLDN